VATILGQGYTVEEQVTGKAEIGGFQFDIFPCRSSVDLEGYFKFEHIHLDNYKTPAELALRNGDRIQLCRYVSQSHPVSMFN
jgi:hypothetical protein